MDNTPFLIMHLVIPKSHTQSPSHRIFSWKQNKSINIKRHLITHNMSRELSYRQWLYKSHKNSRNKQKSPYSKKGGSHLLFSGLESKGGRLHVLTAEEQTPTSALLKSCSGKRWIPWLTLSHDSLCGIIPQTFSLSTGGRYQQWFQLNCYWSSERKQWNKEKKQALITLKVTKAHFKTNPNYRMLKQKLVTV